jgi:hypothetical protein
MMKELIDYVTNYAIRGDCTCGKCLDAPSNPKQPTEHAVDMIFFKVAAINGANADKLKELIAVNKKGEFCDIDLFDGNEHNYMEIGGWIGDQGIALMLMGLGTILGLWDLLTPVTILKMNSNDPVCQQMAGMGMIVIQNNGK